MNPLQKHLLRLLFFLLTFPIALGFEELIVRGFKGVGEARRDTVEASYMPARLRGHFQGTVFGMSFSTNQYGFRGEKDFPRRPPPGEYRILALGDSVGMGLGIETSNQYVKVAERKLNELDSLLAFHIVNAAGQGYSPSSYYVYLKHAGLQLSPSVVIVEIELCNDVTDEALLAWEEDVEQPGTPDRVRGGRYVVSWDGNLLGTFSLGPFPFERTYTYTLLLRRALNLLDRWSPSKSVFSQPGATYYSLGFDRFLLTDKRIEEGWQRLFGALEATSQLLQRRGIPFLLLILPSRYVFNGDARPYQQFASRLLQRAQRLARERGIPYLEFKEEMAANGGANLYLDFAHPTAGGNQVIGEKLFQYLSRLLAGAPDGERTSSPAVDSAAGRPGG